MSALHDFDQPVSDAAASTAARALLCATPRATHIHTPSPASRHHPEKHLIIMMMGSVVFTVEEGRSTHPLKTGQSTI